MSSDPKKRVFIIFVYRKVIMITAKNVYLHGLELEFDRNTQSNESLAKIESWLSNFQFENNSGELIPITLGHKDSLELNKFYPVPHYLERDVFLVRYYTDGSVSDEIVIASNNETKLNKVAREFNKVTRFETREGQHISIHKSKFDVNRIIDHYTFLNSIYCIAEFVLLDFNNKRHRNNDFSNSGNSPFIKEKYPSLLLNKKVERENFLEFRFCNPKKRPFTQLFTRILPQYFNNVSIDEIEQIEKKLQFDDIDFNVSNPKYVLDGEAYNYIMKETELGKILKFFKKDSTARIFHLMKDLKLEELTEFVIQVVKEFETVRIFSDDDLNTLRLFLEEVKRSNGDLITAETRETISQYNLEKYLDLDKYLPLHDHELLEGDGQVEEQVHYIALMSGDKKEMLHQKVFSKLLFNYKPYQERFDLYDRVMKLDDLIEEFKNDSPSKLLHRIMLQKIDQHLKTLPTIQRYVRQRNYWGFTTRNMILLERYF